MNKFIKYIILLTSMLPCNIVLSTEEIIDKNSFKSGLKRVPAEWEPQEATWLQWPGRWEKNYEDTIKKIPI